MIHVTSRYKTTYINSYRFRPYLSSFCGIAQKAADRIELLFKGTKIKEDNNAQTLGDLPHLRTTNHKGNKDNKVPLLVKLKNEARTPLAVLGTANGEMSPLFVEVVNEVYVMHGMYR